MYVISKHFKFLVIVFKGYAVTIIIEGGIGTLEVLENDIRAQRPIVLIRVRIFLFTLIIILLKYRVVVD
jgi:hypothetical protein